MAEKETDTVEVEKTEEQKQEEEKKFLASLKQIEDVLNEGAKKLAAAERIPDGRWKIHLVSATSTTATMLVKGGATCEIILAWPRAQKEIKRYLQDAFKAIARRKLYESFAIERVFHARKVKDDLRKWMRLEYGEESDIILDLIPKWRLEETVKTVYTLKDTKTGMSITVESEKKGHFSQQKIDNWIALSRIVREVDKIDDGLDEIETPELDKAQA